MSIEQLCDAAKNGQHTEVERLILLCSPEQIERSEALRQAAYNGHVECVKLLTAARFEVNDYPSLWWAIQNGHTDCVTVLLQRLDPKKDDSYALYVAARNGWVDILQLLLPLTDPLAQESRALGGAAAKGSAECVQALIPVSNPKADNSGALFAAVRYNHMACIELLYPVSDPQKALERLRLIYPDETESHFLLQGLIEREHLRNVVGDFGVHSVRKI